MCVWQELPGQGRNRIKTFSRTFPRFIKNLFAHLNFLNPELFIHKKLFLEKSYFYFCFAGYDTEYTEADSKDIQNLAQEIETKYTQYGMKTFSSS